MATIATSPRRLRLLLPGVAIAFAALLGAPDGARATHNTVSLRGDLTANTFKIRAVDANVLEFCTVGVSCFTRTRSSVDAITVDGFDGDDVLLIDHGSDLVTDDELDLPVTFVGGVGDDRLRVCDEGTLCTAVEATVLGPGAQIDELRLVQNRGTRSLVVTMRDVGEITDRSAGTLVVEGTAADDIVTYGSDPSDAGLGRATVNTSAPYRFAGKKSVKFALGAGADGATLAGTPGLTASPQACDPSSAPVCVEADDVGDDRVVAAGRSGVAEEFALTPRAAGASLLARSNTSAVGLAGVDDVDLTLQEAEDTARVTTTSGDDLVQVAADAGTGPAVVTGRLDRAGSPYPLQTLRLTAGGGDPLRLVLAAGSGTDEVVHEATARDDVLLVAPTNNDPSDARIDTACTQTGSDCLEAAAAGRPRYRLTATGVERYAAEGGDGDDALTAGGDLAADTSWRGGAGADAVAFAGTGAATTVDLGAGSIRQGGTALQPSPGQIDVGGVEVLGVRAGGARVDAAATAGDDALTVSVTGTKAATLSRAGDDRTLKVADAAVLVVDPLGGDDNFTIDGTSTADHVAVGRGTSLAVTVTGYLPVRASGATEAALVRGGGGNDRFMVSGDGGPPTFAVHGGADTGEDVLGIATPLVDAAVQLDDVPGSGQLWALGPAVGFDAAEAVELESNSSGTLTVLGSDVADTLVQSGNSVLGRGTRVRYTSFKTLRVHSGAADDVVQLEPTTTSLGAIEVDGAGGADGIRVLGSALGERIAYRAEGLINGRVEVASAPGVAFSGSEEVQVDGRSTAPAADRLVVETPELTGTLLLEPGATADSGTVRIRDASGAATAAPPLSYGSLGRGRVEFAGASRTDSLVYRGTPVRDVFTVDVADPAGIVSLNTQVPVHTQGIRTLTLEGLDDADLFKVPTSHPFGDRVAAAAGIHVAGAGPSDADHAEIAGGGGALRVDAGVATVSEAGYAPIAHSGLSTLAVRAAGGTVKVVGSADPDEISFAPTAADAASISGGGPALALSGVAGPLLLDTVGGADAVTVRARTVADAISVARGPATQVGVGNLLPLEVPEATVESLDVGAGDGDDVITVSGAGGPSSLAIHGEAPSGSGDRLRLVDPSVTVTYGTDPSGGRLDSSGGPLSFTTMESIDAVGSGAPGDSLTLRGTGGNDSLTIGSGGVPRASVNNGAEVTYGGYPTIVLDGREAQDVFTVSYVALGDVQTVRVIGADPALGEELIVQDNFGTSSRWTFTPTGPGEGVLTVDSHTPRLAVESTEMLRVDGRGGDDGLLVITPSGTQDVRATAGDLIDVGTLQVAAHLPLSFQQFGGCNSVTVSDRDGVRADRLIVAGRRTSDTFTITRDRGMVQLGGWLPVFPSGVTDVVLEGLDGDDTFDVLGPLPYRSTVLNGGAPDDGDRATLEGPEPSAAQVRVDLNAATATGYGGTISFPGMFRLHTDIAGKTLVETGTARDDAMCYDPEAPRAGRVYIVGAPGGGSASSICLPDLRGTNVLHTFVDVARFIVDPVGGADEVIVNGSVDRDVVTIHTLETTSDPSLRTSEVTVHPKPEEGGTFRLPVEVVIATTESVVAAADSGSDSIDVTVYNRVAPRFTVYGEGPSTKLTGDDMVVRDGSGRAHLHNTTAHEHGDGTVTATYRSTGIEVRVDYHGVEKVTLLRDSKEN